MSVNTSGSVSWQGIAAATGGGEITFAGARNGLSLTGDVDAAFVELGGVLYHRTSIDLAGFELIFSSTSNVAGGPYIENLGANAASTARLTLRNDALLEGYIELKSLVGGSNMVINSIFDLVFIDGSLSENGRVLAVGGMSTPVNTGYGFAGFHGQAGPGMSSAGSNLQLRSKTNNPVALMHGNVVMMEALPQGNTPFFCDGSVGAGVFGASDSFWNTQTDDIFLNFAVNAEPAPTLATEYWEVMINNSLKKIAILQ